MWYNNRKMNNERVESRVSSWVGMSRVSPWDVEKLEQRVTWRGRALVGHKDL